MKSERNKQPTLFLTANQRQEKLRRVRNLAWYLLSDYDICEYLDNEFLLSFNS